MNNYQCSGCGVMISADPAVTTAVKCTACDTLLTLGSLDVPVDQHTPGNVGTMEYQCPGCGAYIAADPRVTPAVQCNDCSTIIKLGHDLPNTGANISSTSLPVPAQGGEDFTSIIGHEEGGNKSVWKSLLLRPRALVIGLVLAPVIITVLVGVILVFIRSGTGIASGVGDPMIQGGSIVLGILSLWSMYILGATFFYADRDWVTDFGLGVVVLGGCWGIYVVINSFPPTILAMVGHLFLGYIAVCAPILAIRLMAPYKGIGSVRFNEGR